eukprot:TRINITY_DN37324_c0_g1_i1.p1 TRINITY_DN37324_c0_g1~~TRINITY_DN37324_c0_g1_i1.p1  ORF type:complete len:553 (+),score=217.53 TRINITY_DN37324_c0_g1_i1:115-1773(+)
MSEMPAFKPLAPITLPGGGGGAELPAAIRAMQASGGIPPGAAAMAAASASSAPKGLPAAFAAKAAAAAPPQASSGPGAGMSEEQIKKLPAVLQKKIREQQAALEKGGDGQAADSPGGGQQDSKLAELQKMREEQLQRLNKLQEQLNNPNKEEGGAAPAADDEDDDSWRADAESFLSGLKREREEEPEEEEEETEEDKKKKAMMQMMMMQTMQQMMQNAMKLKELEEKKGQKKQEALAVNTANLPAALRKGMDSVNAIKENVAAATEATGGMMAAGASSLPAGILAAKAKIDGFVDPQQAAMAEAAKELQAAQEAAAAQQAAFAQMTPEQQQAIYEAMNSANVAQEAIQKQFADHMKAHEAEKLAASGFYLMNQPDRFKDGYRPLRLCKHWPTGDCWRGTECTFGHNFEELHPASPDIPRTQKTSTDALAEQQRVIDSAPDVRLKKKKALCDKWKNNDCVLGRACPYAHGEKELGTVELVICGKVKTKMCKFWTRGNCMFPENCVNAHGEQELGTKRPEFLTPPMKKRREGESIDDFRDKVIHKGGGKGGGRR